ncbi:hypothetical protein K8R62_00295 [bacterium]|nr:hypothetical protein [bacterium]
MGIRNARIKKDREYKKTETPKMVRSNDKTDHGRLRLHERAGAFSGLFTVKEIKKLIKSGKVKIKKDKNGAILAYVSGWKIVLSKNMKSIISAYPKNS